MTTALLSGLTPETLALLAAAAFVAGFLDAIAGGGGLITVPAYALAGLDPATAVATNKVNGAMGVAAASLAFARRGAYRDAEPWRIAAGAAVGGAAGALLLSRVPTGWLATAMPVALIVIALYFAFTPSLGDSARRPRVSTAVAAGVFAPLIGLYDGLFGPGAGSFYMIVCVALLGRSALRATAETKLANLASNLASLIAFGLLGKIVWPLGLTMGLAQGAGSALGARAAVAGGARLIRPLIVLVSLALAARLMARAAGWG
jgi:hypothetical protein